MFLCTFILINFTYKISYITNGCIVLLVIGVMFVIFFNKDMSSKRISNNIDTNDLEEKEMSYSGAQVETQFLNHAQRDLESRIQVVSVILLYGVGHALFLLSLMSNGSMNVSEFIPDREQRRGELM